MSGLPEPATSSRGAFLARVATAVRQGNRVLAAAPQDREPSTGYLGCGADPIARLMSEIQSCGGNAYRISNRDEAHALLRDLVERFSVSRVIRNESQLLDSLGVDDVLASLKVVVARPRDLAPLDEATRQDRVFQADLGIASVDFAIAETGSLVYVASAGQMRSTSLLPPIHLAIVTPAAILADLVELPSRIGSLGPDGRLPSNVVLITGPSKTGDIELRLTTGVHGPGELHVIILEWELE